MTWLAWIVIFLIFGLLTAMLYAFLKDAKSLKLTDAEKKKIAARNLQADTYDEKHR